MATAKPPWAGTYDMKNKFQLIRIQGAFGGGGGGGGSSGGKSL